MSILILGPFGNRQASFLLGPCTTPGLISGTVGVSLRPLQYLISTSRNLEFFNMDAQHLIRMWQWHPVFMEVSPPGTYVYTCLYAHAHATCLQTCQVNAVVLISLLWRLHHSWRGFGEAHTVICQCSNLNVSPTSDKT